MPTTFSEINSSHNINDNVRSLLQIDLNFSPLLQVRVRALKKALILDIDFTVRKGLSHNEHYWTISSYDRQLLTPLAG